MSQDNAEFAEFFAASWDPCLRAVAASTGNLTLAEDQTAEAFARACASWHKVSQHPAPQGLGSSYCGQRRDVLVASAEQGNSADQSSDRGSRQPASAPNTRAVHAVAPAGKGTNAGTVQTAAFVLTSNANGTDTLTLTMTMNQMLDATTLQQALTQHGIPALVKRGTYCSSVPAAPDPVSAGVLSIRLPAGPHKMVPASSGPAPSELKQMAARTVTVINPAALPSGTELFFGYSSSIHAVFTDLIYTISYTCSGNP